MCIPTKIKHETIKFILIIRIIRETKEINRVYIQEIWLLFNSN